MMYKFVAYIPEPQLEQVKTALFEAGAGRLGCYSHCSWQVLGIGQFKPLVGANPAIGCIDSLESVAEWRVEMVVGRDELPKVLEAYKLAHPYEMPAYDIYQLVDVADLG